MPANLVLFVGVISAETVRRFFMQAGKLHCQPQFSASTRRIATEKAN
jgi:hypothetical protein